LTPIEFTDTIVAVTPQLRNRLSGEFRRADRTEIDEALCTATMEAWSKKPTYFPKRVALEIFVLDTARLRLIDYMRKVAIRFGARTLGPRVYDPSTPIDRRLDLIKAIKRSTHSSMWPMLWNILWYGYTVREAIGFGARYIGTERTESAGALRGQLARALRRVKQRLRDDARMIVPQAHESMSRG